MSNEQQGESGLDLAAAVSRQIPYLRRYARALTGSRAKGDDLAAATLEALLSEPERFDRDLHPKLALFKVFHHIWRNGGATAARQDSALVEAATAHLARLTENARETLLLSAIEGLSVAEIAQVLGLTKDDARALLDTAYREMEDSLRGRIMIIEDEAIIAMDLESIVRSLGHSVTGIARTRKGAVALAAQDLPDLILADIHLADDSSGIEAVKDIVRDNGDCPVIFITAYPERLLKGERYEPAFMIAKPYSEDQVKVAVSQAMFFSSTETLRA